MKDQETEWPQESDWVWATLNTEAATWADAQTNESPEPQFWSKATKALTELQKMAD